MIPQKIFFYNIFIIYNFIFNKYFKFRNIEFVLLILYNRSVAKIIHGGVIGFDGVLEARIASSGFSFATLKNGKLNINADNRELALAA